MGHIKTFLGENILTNNELCVLTNGEKLMSIEQRHDGSVWIQEFSIADFVKSIQECVLNGYELSFENDKYPQGFSSHYYCGMIPVAKKQSKEVAKQEAKAEVVVDAVDTEEPVKQPKTQQAVKSSRTATK